MTGDIDIEPVCRGSSETPATTVTDEMMMDAGVGSSPTPSGISDRLYEYETCCTYEMKAFNLTTNGTRISGFEQLRSSRGHYCVLRTVNSQLRTE